MQSTKLWYKCIQVMVGTLPVTGPPSIKELSPACNFNTSSLRAHAQDEP